MDFRILGPLEVWNGSRPLDLGGPKQRALLAILLLHRGEVLSTERLIDDLWGERPPASAAKTLQIYVSRLRKALGDGVLATRARGYTIECGPSQVDADRFEHLVERGRALLAAGDARSADPMLREALGLWRGQLLADFGYEQFAQAEAARLDELRMSALEDSIDARLQAGAGAELVPQLEALVREHPLRERLREQLMLALYRAGRQAEALKAYRDARRTLLDGLGIEPSARLRSLESDILAQHPALDGTAERPRLGAGERSRRGLALILGGTLLVAAAIGATLAVLLAGGTSARLTAAAADSLGVIDAASGGLVAQVPVGSAPVAVAADDSSVWVANAGDRTLLRVDPATRKVVATVGLGRIPAGIALGAGSAWVAEPIGDTGLVARVDAASNAVVGSYAIRHGDEGDGFAPPSPTAIAAGPAAVWTNHVREKVTRLGTSGAPTTRTLALGGARSADGIAVGAGGTWVTSSATDELLRLDPEGTKVRAAIKIAAAGRRLAAPYGVAVGDGSVWVADSQANAVSRVDPALNAVTATIRVGRRPTQVAVGAGAVWVLDSGDGTVTKIDPRTNAVSRSIPVGTDPTAIAVSGHSVYVTVAGGRPAVGGPQASPRFQPVASSSCSRVFFGGPGTPDRVIASDFPRVLPTDSYITAEIVDAIRYVLRSKGFRAGRYRVGYQACDDSAPPLPGFDVARCQTNARAYAATRSLIGLIGPYNSGCAMIELPLLNASPGGPLPTISPSDTYVGLTRAGPATAPDEPERYFPTGTRSYFRVIGADDRQGAADALLAHQLGVRRLFVLDDGAGTGLADGEYTAAAARKLGIEIAGRASWDPGAATYLPLAARIARSRADGVYVAGCMCANGVRLFRQIRARLGAGVKLLAPDAVLDVMQPPGAPGRATEGMYVSVAGTPAAELDARGRSFAAGLRAFAHLHKPLDVSVAPAAQATVALLDAIARSRGTRSSVIAQLESRVFDGPLGPMRFDANGDPTRAAIGVYRVAQGAPRHGPAFALTHAGLTVDRVVTPPAALVAQEP